MNTDFPDALLAHVERIADALERQNYFLEQFERPDDLPGGRTPRHLSLFLENLPTRNYEHLRLKLLPARMAADISGLSPAELRWLDSHGFIKSENGFYDVLSILMWLDSDENPDTGGGFNA